MWKRAHPFAFVGLAWFGASACAGAQAIQDPASIAHAAEAFVRAQVPTRTQASVRIRATGLDARLRLAACGAPLAVKWSAGAALKARTSVVVGCPDGARWRINVPLTLHSEIDVLVLKAPAARGRSLAAADVTIRRVEVEGLAHLYIQKPAELTGRHLARSAPAGVPLSTAWFAPDDLVERGQAVTLVASAEGILIRAPGRALADGALHERVRVQNLSSLKVVEGVVENSSEVRVSQ
ncbi:MAG: flagellar basal body P-ring formation chaperone FlgA [Steroidobacteraceae bacterium]